MLEEERVEHESGRDGACGLSERVERKSWERMEP